MEKEQRVDCASNRAHCDISTEQNVLIVKAALTVLQNKEKSTGIVDESLYREFEAAVEAVISKGLSCNKKNF